MDILEDIKIVSGFKDSTLLDVYEKYTRYCVYGHQLNLLHLVTQEITRRGLMNKIKEQKLKQ